MERSTKRIPTTHVGSLIRPEPLLECMRSKLAGKPVDDATDARVLRESVAEIVREQARVGVDLVSDGECGKAISWSQYALERLSGFERRTFRPGTNNP